MLGVLRCVGGVLVCWVGFFFFFKQKTAYEMRISDWSSDVCSSDLQAVPAHGDGSPLRRIAHGIGQKVRNGRGKLVGIAYDAQAGRYVFLECVPDRKSVV